MKKKENEKINLENRNKYLQDKNIFDSRKNKYDIINKTTNYNQINDMLNDPNYIKEDDRKYVVDNYYSDNFKNCTKMKQIDLLEEAKNNNVSQTTSKGISEIAKAIAQKKALLKYLDPGGEPNERIKLNFGDNDNFKLEEKNDDDDDDEEANDNDDEEEEFDNDDDEES